MFALAILTYGVHIFLNSNRVFFSLGNNYSKLVVSAVFFFAFLSYFFSVNEIVTFFWLIQLFKLLIVYLFVINRLVSEKNLIMLILYCLVFQAFLGFLQFTLQSSVGLSFLGESRIGPDILNVAKIDVGNLKIVRPYGTFTHANVFGGLLSIGFLLTGYLYIQELISKKKSYTLLTIFSIGVLLSFSRAAFVATFASIMIFLAFRKFKITYSKIRNFTLAFSGIIFLSYLTGVLNLVLIRLKFADAGIIERVDQIKTSFAMMLAHPFGVGIGNYTNVASQISPDKLMPWQFEPVHNVFLLIGTELGIMAVLWAITITIIGLLKLFRLLTVTEGKYKCFPIYFSIILITHLIVLANLDHYFYTNHTAGVFVVVTLGIMTNYLANLEENGVSLRSI